MDFNFSDFGGQQMTAAQLSEQSGGGDFQLMPAHKNQLILEQLEVKQNEVTGTINLTVTSQIVGNEYNGRKIWKRYNLVKKDGTLNEITQYQLGDLALSVGYPEEQVLKSPLELNNYLNVPFQADIKVEKGTGNYQDSNTYANPKKIGVAGAAQAQPKPQQPQQPQGFGAQGGGFGQQSGGFGAQTKPFGQ